MMQMILIIKNHIMKKYYFTIIVLLIIYISVAWYDVKQNNNIQETQKTLDNKQDQLDQIQTEIKKDLEKLKKLREEKPEETPKEDPKPIQTTKQIVIDQQIYKKWWSKDDPRQDLINYAYKIGWKDFLYTLDNENWLWDYKRRSNMVWSNGYSDYWLCQLNGQWHWKFMFANGYNLKKWFSNDFLDPYKQLDYCWGVFQDGVKRGIIKTTFYAYNVRHRSEGKFENL